MRDRVSIRVIVDVVVTVRVSKLLRSDNCPGQVRVIVRVVVKLGLGLGL